MKSQTQPSKKVLDISRPKKRPAAADVPSAPQLVIPKRSIIVPVSEPESPVSEPIEAKQVAESVQPVTGPAAEPEPESEQSPAAPEPSEASAEVETQTDETAPGTSEEPAEAEEPESTDAGSKPSKASPHVRKALENAKREQELQEYIANRDFFVPINAVARKRSLKVSVALAFLELLLGLLLLNLMLDAGIIQLLEKVPHTNIFDLQ